MTRLTLDNIHTLKVGDILFFPRYSAVTDWSALNKQAQIICEISTKTFASYMPQHMMQYENVLPDNKITHYFIRFSVRAAEWEVYGIHLQSNIMFISL